MVRSNEDAYRQDQYRSALKMGAMAGGFGMGALAYKDVKGLAKGLHQNVKTKVDNKNYQKDYYAKKKNMQDMLDSKAKFKQARTGDIKKAQSALDNIELSSFDAGSGRRMASSISDGIAKATKLIKL